MMLMLSRLSFALLLGAWLLLPRTARASSWTEVFSRRIAKIDAGVGGGLGVYVHEIGSGESFSLRGDEPWYLASGIKVPVAIAVLREVDAGALPLAARIRLEPTDFVDGAGQTNGHPPGAELRVDYLLEQMLVHSDNTATDALIRTVGLGRVNAVAMELMGQPVTITSLSDVRRHAYRGLHPRASALTSSDLLALKRVAPNARVGVFARLIGVPHAELRSRDLGRSFDAYYETKLNAAPLRAYGKMLAAVVEGKALSPKSTAYLLAVMGRAQTGRKRIKAGLSRGSRFAHKTGTQHRRVCDLGVVRVAGGKDVIVAACVRGSSLATSEGALREVGSALSVSGVLRMPHLSKTRSNTTRVDDEPPRAVGSPGRLPAGPDDHPDPPPLRRPAAAAARRSD
jgi:beta-lactamase class A